MAVIGAGYIAVELTGVFNALGTETHLFTRKERAMRTLDPYLSDILDSEVLAGSVCFLPLGCDEQRPGCLLFWT